MKRLLLILVIIMESMCNFQSLANFIFLPGPYEFDVKKEADGTEWCVMKKDIKALESTADDEYFCALMYSEQNILGTKTEFLRLRITHFFETGFEDSSSAALFGLLNYQFEPFSKSKKSHHIKIELADGVTISGRCFSPEENYVCTEEPYYAEETLIVDVAVQAFKALLNENIRKIQLTCGDDPDTQLEYTFKSFASARTLQAMVEHFNSGSNNSGSVKSSKSANIHYIDIEHDVYRNGVKGLNVLATFTVNGMKGKTGQIVAYFIYEDGSPLKDLNGKYDTTDGDVSSGENFTPRYDSAKYTDFKIFIPLKELHLGSGSTTVKVFVAIFDENLKQIGQVSDYDSFVYSKN